jgi:tyrosyl-tRNA synthetase
MLTFIPLEQIDAMDQWEGSQLNEAKEILAYELTKLVHGEQEAQNAKNTSHALFAGGTDSNMPTTEIAAEQMTDGVIGIMDLMVVCGIAPSKSEARRLIQQGGVFINDAKIESIDNNITSEQLKIGVKIRKGKKTYHKVLMK